MAVQNYQPRILLKDGIPSDSEGYEGEIRIGQLDGKLYQFVRYQNKWHSIPFSQSVGEDLSQSIANVVVQAKTLTTQTVQSIVCDTIKVKETIYDNSGGAGISTTELINHPSDNNQAHSDYMVSGGEQDFDGSIKFKGGTTLGAVANYIIRGYSPTAATENKNVFFIGNPAYHSDWIKKVGFYIAPSSIEGIFHIATTSGQDFILDDDGKLKIESLEVTAGISGSSLDINSNATISSSGALEVVSINTGEGATEVYPTADVVGGQSITASGNAQGSSAINIAVTDDSIGDTQLVHETGQHLRSTDAVQHARLGLGVAADETKDLTIKSAHPRIELIDNNDSDSSVLLANNSGHLDITPTDGIEVASNKYIKSMGATSGFGGTGLNITVSGNKYHIECEELTVRGQMNVYELLINQIRATNGSLFVTTAHELSGFSNYHAVEDDTALVSCKGNFLSDTHPFVNDDILLLQYWSFTGTSTRRYLKVTDAGAGTNLQFYAFVYDVNGDQITGADIDDEEDIFIKGKTLCRIGSASDTDRQGGIYLTSDDSNAPYLSIWNGLTAPNQWGTSGVEKLRLGNLDGASNQSGGTISGTSYGLSAQDVYLTGHLHATTGYIGNTDSGWAIDSLGIVNTASNVNARIAIGTGGFFNANQAFYVDGSGQFSLYDKFKVDTDGSITITGNFYTSDNNPIGPGMTWQGDWSESTTYQVNDGVAHNGASYICILSTLNNEPPNSTYWEAMALSGSDGTPGNPGNPGIDGNPGNPGSDGSDGNPGNPGSNGIDGTPGNPGTDGSDGTPGSNGADGTPGSNGADGNPGAPGAAAKGIHLSLESSTISYNNSTGTPVLNPAGATQDFKVYGVLTNISGENVTYTIKDTDGTAQTDLTFSNGSHTITDMSGSQGWVQVDVSSWDTVASGDSKLIHVSVEDDGVTYTDEQRIYALFSGQSGSDGTPGNPGADGEHGNPGSNGIDGVTAFLTNETHVISWDGSTPNYTNSGGNFKVFSGTEDVTSSSTFTGDASNSGLTMTMNESTGEYSLSGDGWSSAQESFTLTATYNGVSYPRVYTIAKSFKGEAGTDGTPGSNGIDGTPGTPGSNGTPGSPGSNGTDAVVVSLTSNHHAISYDGFDALKSPATYNLTAYYQGLSDTVYLAFYQDGVFKTEISTSAGNGQYEVTPPASPFGSTQWQVKIGTSSINGGGSVLALDTISIYSIEDPELQIPQSGLTIIPSDGVYGVSNYPTLASENASTVILTGSEFYFWDTGGSFISIGDSPYESFLDGTAWSNLGYIAIDWNEGVFSGTIDYVDYNDNILTNGDIMVLKASDDNWAAYRLQRWAPASGADASGHQVFVLSLITYQGDGPSGYTSTTSIFEYVGFTKSLEGIPGPTGPSGADGADGTPTYSVIIENENHTFPVEDGAVSSFEGGGGKVWVYKGTELLNPISSGSPTTGEVKISAQTISSWINASISDDGDAYFNINGPTEWTDMSKGYATLTFSLAIESDANVVSKRVSYSLATEGADGADGTPGTPGSNGTNGADGANGTDAQTVMLTASSYAVDYSSGSASPTTITFTAVPQGTPTANHYYDFQVDGVSINNTTATSKEWTVPESNFNTPKTVTVDLRLGANDSDIIASDALSIYGVTNGNPGTDGTPGNPGTDGTPGNPGNPGSDGGPGPSGEPGLAAEPTYSKVLEYTKYGELNATGFLAFTPGGYSFHTETNFDSIDYNLASWNTDYVSNPITTDFSTAGLFLINKYDTNVNLHNDYIAGLTVGDNFVYQIASDRWYKFQITGVGPSNSAYGQAFTVDFIAENITGGETAINNYYPGDNSESVFFKFAKSEPGPAGPPGADGYTVILTNPAHALPRDASGTISYANSGTSVQVYKGGQLLIPTDASGAPQDGYFKVLSVADDNITAGAQTVYPVGNYIRFDDHSDWANVNVPTAEITINLEVESTQLILGATQSLTLTQDGAPGGDGADGADGSDGSPGPPGADGTTSNNIANPEYSTFEWWSTPLTPFNSDRSVSIVDNSSGSESTDAWQGTRMVKFIGHTDTSNNLFWFSPKEVTGGGTNLVPADYNTGSFTEVTSPGDVIISYYWFCSNTSGVSVTHKIRYAYDDSGTTVVGTRSLGVKTSSASWQRISYRFDESVVGIKPLILGLEIDDSGAQFSHYIDAFMIEDAKGQDTPTTFTPPFPGSTQHSNIYDFYDPPLDADGNVVGDGYFGDFMNDPQRLGFVKDGNWITYMGGDGDFFLTGQGDNNNYLQWDSSESLLTINAQLAIGTETINRFYVAGGNNGKLGVNQYDDDASYNQRKIWYNNIALPDEIPSSISEHNSVYNLDEGAVTDEIDNSLIMVVFKNDMTIRWSDYIVTGVYDIDNLTVQENTYSNWIAYINGTATLPSPVSEYIAEDDLIIILSKGTTIISPDFGDVLINHGCSNPFGHSGQGSIYFDTEGVVGWGVPNLGVSNWQNAFQTSHAYAFQRRFKNGAGTGLSSVVASYGETDKFKLAELEFTYLNGVLNGGGAGVGTSINGNLITTGSIQSNNYIVGSPSDEYTSTGTIINLSDGSIQSKNFYIKGNGDASFSGALSAASGTFTGQVDAGGVKIGDGVNTSTDYGLYMGSTNYWYKDNSSAIQFVLGSADNYITFSSDELSIKATNLTLGSYNLNDPDNLISYINTSDSGVRIGGELIDVSGRTTFSSGFGINRTVFMFDGTDSASQHVSSSNYGWLMTTSLEDSNFSNDMPGNLTFNLSYSHKLHNYRHHYFDELYASGISGIGAGPNQGSGPGEDANQTDISDYDSDNTTVVNGPELPVDKPAVLRIGNYSSTDGPEWFIFNKQNQYFGCDEAVDGHSSEADCDLLAVDHGDGLAGHWKVKSNQYSTGQVLRGGNYVWPYRQDRRYKMTVRVKWSADNGAGRLWAGFECYDVGGTRLNAVGTDSSSNQHYFVLQAKSRGTVGGTWRTFTGYIEGWAPPETSPYTHNNNSWESSASSPLTARYGTYYFAPVFICNMDNSSEATSGRIYIDYIKVEEEDSGITVIDGDTITTGTISADRIDVDALVATDAFVNNSITIGDVTTLLLDETTSITGSAIDTGTIDADVVSVANLNADNITSGSLATVSGGDEITQTITEGAGTDNVLTDDDWVNCFSLVIPPNKGISVFCNIQAYGDWDSLYYSGMAGGIGYEIDTNDTNCPPDDNPGQLQWMSSAAGLATQFTGTTNYVNESESDKTFYFKYYVGANGLSEEQANINYSYIEFKRAET